MGEYHFHGSDARDQSSTNAPNSPALVDAATVGAADAGAQGKSQASSVLRHDAIASLNKFEILLCGIDTLDLGVYVQWETDWNAQLTFFDEKKQAAQGTDGILCRTDSGREYLFLPSGMPPQYRFHLKFPEYDLFIAKSEEYHGTPTVYVSFISCAIWHLGISALIDLVECDLAQFGADLMYVVPSRVDLCVDFRVYPPLTKQFLDIHRVCKSQETKTKEDCGKLVSFYCGADKSEVHVTFYDKDREIGVHDKQWFLPIWGTDDPTNIFRVEFRLKRPFLHKYQIYSMYDLRQHLGSIWGYLTSEWFSLRLPDNPETNRRTIHSMWAAIQKLGVEIFGGNGGVRRKFKTDNMESIRKMLPQIMGRTITIAALEGITDRKQSFHHLSKLLEQCSDDETFNEKRRKKCIKLGYRGELGGYIR